MSSLLFVGNGLVGLNQLTFGGKNYIGFNQAVLAEGSTG